MNLFKPKASSSSPEPLQLQGAPPAVKFLQQVFSSFQTNLSNFVCSTPKYPVLATISDSFKALSLSSPPPPSSSSYSYSGGNDDGSGSRKSFPVMSAEAIEERLAGVPVYALSNSSGEVVLVSGSHYSKKLGLFCFNKGDAVSFLEQLKSLDPSAQGGAQVVAVALNKLVQTKVDGISFRLIPEASQVKNAIKERNISGANDNSFPGVPVFQSKRLVVWSQNKRYRPVFFRKEDLEKSLHRASQDQNVMNPALRVGRVEVAVLEDIIQGMKDNSSSEWNDVLFVPPGYDVDTGGVSKWHMEVSGGTSAAG